MVGCGCPPWPPGTLLALENSQASLYLAFPGGRVAWELEWRAHSPALCFAESRLDPCQQALPPPIWPGTWPTLSFQPPCHWQLHR